MALRLITAGESHGPGLTCIVEGLPAGLLLDEDVLNRDMARRQLGHGRGGRMKIERDSAQVTAGVRHGSTLAVNAARSGGLDLVRRLRKREFNGKILVLSAHLSDADIQAYEELRVDMMMSKPFDFEEIQNAVAVVTRGASLELAS